MVNSKWKWIVTGIIVMITLMRSGIEKFAEAIKEFEGWYPGSPSYRNNNPGNLKYHNQPGATAEDNKGHAIFDSYISGWNALIHQLEIAIDGRSNVYEPTDTLYEFFGKYAERNTTQYAEFVARYLGVDPNTAIRDLV